MGQLNYPTCPICSGENAGRGACGPCTTTVDTFRRLLRHLQAWRSLYEESPAEDLEILRGPDGREWSLLDVERFYGYRRLLPDQQRRCLELFLFGNMYERDVARELGVGRGAYTSVAIYATVGLIRMLALCRAGELPGVNFEFEVDMPPAPVPPVPPELPEPDPLPNVLTLLFAGTVTHYPLLAERVS